MNDKELLELAAKAAGIPRAAFEHDPANPDEPYWSPLTDDGDALRLAVKLRLDVSTPYYQAQHLTRPLVRSQDLKHGVCCNEGDQEMDDLYAATRRAIVRATAEVGKGIPQRIIGDVPEDNYYKTQAEAEEMGRVSHPKEGA